ncbi:MAG: RNA polymerase sigma factor [Candidatus Nomurabacteria bacterium]
METKNLKNKFKELYDKESNSIFRFCILRVSDRDIALDLTQDVFMRYWNYLLQNKKINSDKALLFAIARNCIIDWYRKKKNLSLEMLTETNENNFNNESIFLRDNTNNKIEINAEVEIFIKKINEIDLKYREEVYLRFVEDLTPKEISEVLEKSVNLVSVHINRGLHQLRELLDI